MSTQPDGLGEMLAASEQKLQAISTTMGSITSLVVKFAEQMLESGMPVDTVYRNHLNYDEDRVIGRTEMPAWFVLRDSDLSGRPLVSARIGRSVCSYSLLSHTPNDYRTKWEKANSSNIDDLIAGADYDDAISYTESAVVVTPALEILRVGRSYFRGHYSDGSYPDSDSLRFIVSNRPIVPNDFFDGSAEYFYPKLLVSNMKERRTQQAELYAKRKMDDMTKGCTEKPSDYYDNHDVPVELKPAGSAAKASRWQRFMSAVRGDV